MIKRDFTKKIEEFQSRNNQDKLKFLSDFWDFPIKNEPFKLIGTYEKSDKPDKNGKEYGFFVNVRSTDGDILYYPFNLGQVRIWVEHRENLLSKEFWQFDVEMYNKNDKNPFQLNLANRTFGNPKNKFFDRIEKEKLIRKIFIETGYTQRDAKNTSNALKKIAGDLYTETERFIFELLQNADDIPNERGEVDVRFILLLENLLFLHNGKPFDNYDVESISSIGDSTKRKDAEKTGYKGIGFKSVFTDADTVLINSGNYSFSFDRYSPLYNGQNIEEIPWEIKPIWTEVYRYPKEVKANEDFFKYPVAIDLEVGDKKIITYRQQISQLFSEPRFILFLRHVKCIEVQGLVDNIKIQKQKKGERFELLCNENPIDEWIIDDFDFSVSQEIRDAMSNDKIVPPKLKEIQKSKLSFACQIKDNEIINISPEKSYLFTYLPTNVNDYKFPFLVNADFLTTANRQSIHIKNSWNLYLFEQVGFLCFKWISKLSQINELRNSITNLIPEYYENDNEPIHLHFNKGFDNAISEIAFLPTYKTDLTKVCDAIVDLTGFTDIIGDKLFLGTPYANKNLVINELLNKDILTKLIGITIFGKEELINIFENSTFWEITTPEMVLEILNRNKELGIESCDIRDIIENANPVCFNNWIAKYNNEFYDAFLAELESNNLRQKTKERICNLKLFWFSNSVYYSFNDIISITYDSYKRPIARRYYYSNVIIHNNKTYQIKSVLERVGFVTSEKNLSEYPNIYSCIAMPAEKALFDLIADKCKTNTLTSQEKKSLFLNFIAEETKFDGIAEGTLKDLNLFLDGQEVISSLCELVDSKLQTPTWINPYKIKEDENFAELKQFLIPEKELYKKIIIPKWDIIIKSVTNAVEFYYKVEYYYGLDANNSPLKTQKFVYTKHGFLLPGQAFFNSEMINLGNQYVHFQSAIQSLFGLPTPEKAITNFLLKEPFRIDGSKFCGRTINITSLDVYEIKAVLSFCKLNNEQFFKNCIVKKEGANFKITPKSSDKFQISSPDKEAREFIDEYCAEQLFVLPYEFAEYKDEDGIIRADDLHGLILDCVDVNDHKETLVNIVRYRAKYQLMIKLSEFSFIADKKYIKEDYEYKILELACAELKDIDYPKFKEKVKIEIATEILNLSEIPPFADKIKIDGVELSLSEILPDTYQHSNVLSNLIERFIMLGLSKEKLHSLFDINSDPEPESIFELISDRYTVLQNAQQLAFLLLYNKINDVNFEKFKVETLDDKSWELKYPYYSQPFSFIGADYLLKIHYSDISKILDLPMKIGKSENQVLFEPYFTENEFVCPCIKSSLSDEEKIDLLEFIFNKWTIEGIKPIINSINWFKIDNTETEKILGFNPRYSVFPNEYAFDDEKLPEYLIQWISTDKNKISFLSDLGIWVGNTVVVDLRKYLNGESEEFINNRLAQEIRFNNDEKMLFNSLEWLKENQIQLSTNEQYETFKKVVDIINENRNSADLLLEEEIDFESLEENSTVWGVSFYQVWKEKSHNKFSIYLYEGKLPKKVGLDEIKDYIFYRFNDGDGDIDSKNNIYINKSADIKKELQKLASADDNDFTFEYLWDIFGNVGDETAELRKKVAFLENQLQHKPDAQLGAGYDNSISKNDQIETNREAKEIVRERLVNEGFGFTQGIDGYSTIDGVVKDDIEYPLVVKSYKWRDEPLKIGANEWLQLMKPNSMFWVHFGSRELGCLKLYELLRNQDKLTISFSSENLDYDNRLFKFAELLHYFGNVHFDFSNIKPVNYSTSENLEDYRFDERKTEEDLSSDNDNEIR